MESTTERYPRATAYHEAGHAVVGWALGLRVGSIRVRADDAGGGTEIAPADDLSPIEQIALSIAGSAAEELFDCRTHPLASLKDNLEIMKLIKHHKISEEEGPARRAEAYRCAREHLVKHTNKVVKLADRLVERGQVDAVEFLELMQNE